MPFAEANSQLEPLLFQMKQYKNLTKSTIEVLPSSGQTAYGPNRKCIFTLPYASLISLEDLALHFDFEPKNLPAFTDGVVVSRVLPPKDVASLISEVDIKINGQTIQHLTQYNDIVNLLNLFEDAKTAKKVLQGADPINTKVKSGTAGDFVEVKDYKFQDLATKNNVKRSYIINHWYGLLGHRGNEVSSNFLDTNMLGEVTIAFTFARANVCIQSPKPTELLVQKSVSPDSKVLTADIDALYKDANYATYELSGLKMSMVRYNLPIAYSEALRSNLSGGAKYQIAFNHYQIHSQSANKASDSIRWNENSRDIKGLLAFFTNSQRDTGGVPLDYDEKVNTSKYFKYDNTIHASSQFQIGSVKLPQNALNSTDAFLELTRGIAGVRGNNVEFYNKIATVEDWLESYFMAYLSLEMTEGMTEVSNGGKKLLSGMSSENLPISCSYHYTNDSTGFGSTLAWDKNVNVMSLSTRMLVIESSQNCYVEI